MRLLACLLLTGTLLTGTMLVGPVRVATASLTPAPVGEGSWPLTPRPRVVSGFDAPTSPWGSGHRGVDLLGRIGQPVRTSLAGRVSFAAQLAGRGVVVVDHGGVRTTYEPVGARVRLGEAVTRGEVIGRLQRAASHCFPRACLHWGLRRGATYLDPLTLVGVGPVRLLPLEDNLVLGQALSSSRWPSRGAPGIRRAL